MVIWHNKNNLFLGILKWMIGSERKYLFHIICDHTKKHKHHEYYSRIERSGYRVWVSPFLQLKLFSKHKTDSCEMSAWYSLYRIACLFMLPSMFLSELKNVKSFTQSKIFKSIRDITELYMASKDWFPNATTEHQLQLVINEIKQSRGILRSLSHCHYGESLQDVSLQGFR